MKARFEQRGGHLYINGRKVLKGWESFSGWFWFGVERVKDSDELWFGLVQGFVDEWGYFSEHELEELAPKVWRIRPQDLPYSGRRGR